MLFDVVMFLPITVSIWLFGMVVSDEPLWFLPKSVRGRAKRYL